MLRYEPIVPVLARESLENFAVGGIEIEAGRPFLLSVLAANRDPEVIEAPDRFDITREEPHSFSFGWGAHRCLGAAFAQVEIQEAIPTFFECVRNVELLVDEPRWVPFANLRRLEGLPIRFEPVSTRP